MNTPNYIPRLCTLLLIGALCIAGLGAFIPAHRAGEPPANDIHWTVLPNSLVTIKGSSNVNTFGCEASGFFKADALRGNLANDGKSINMRGAITIDINQFDCQNRMLNADLRKTLKADEYPKMTIHFVSLDRLPICDGGEDFISGKVVIELAGQRRLFFLRYSFSKTASGYKLQGSRAFSFADFNLSPPKKIAGLVKVKDDFDVAFTLLLDKCK